jgi:hypothetical protein
VDLATNKLKSLLGLVRKSSFHMLIFHIHFSCLLTQGKALGFEHSQNKGRVVHFGMPSLLGFMHCKAQGQGYMNLNICRSGGVRREGFLHTYYSRMGGNLHLQVDINFLYSVGVGIICLLFSKSDIHEYKVPSEYIRNFVFLGVL